MKNYALILLLFSISCSQQDRKPQLHKTTTQRSVVLTKEQKHVQIEELFSKNGGYDHLNFTYFEKDNYIQIAATSSTNEHAKFEYTEELFWWDNDPYFDQFLLIKIQKKIYEMTYSKHKTESRKKPLKRTVTYNDSKSTNC